MKVVIREARQRDAKQLSELYIQFWKPHSWRDPLMKFKRDPTARSEAKRALSELRKRDRQIYVAEVDEELVGYIEVLLCENDKPFLVKHYGYINSCAVLRKYRRLGIARKLMRAAVGFCRDHKIKYMKLSVFNSNEKAYNAWERMGFKAQTTTMIKKI